MGFLDKPVGELSLAELQRLIRQEVGSQMAAIPTGVLSLTDLDVPLVPPDTATNKQALVYDAPTGSWIAGDVQNFDGLAPGPANTPTLVAGIGTIHAFWTAVTNASPVTYEVHVSASSGFTPSGSTKYAETSATAVTIKTDPATGKALDYATTYYVKIVAKDVDGSATASGEASATPARVVDNDITASSITGDKIVANSLIADLISSVLVQAATIRTADSGRRVEISNEGIQLIDSDGSILVYLPTSSDPAQFNGTAILSTTVIQGFLTMQGATNLLDKGALLTLTDALADPSIKPTVDFNYPRLALSDTTTFRRGLAYTTAGQAAGNLKTYYSLYQSTANDVWHLGEYDATTGTRIRQVIVWTESDVLSGKNVFGTAVIGSNVYVLVTDASGVSGRLQIKKYDIATLTLQSTSGNLAGPPGAFDASGQFGFGTDGTNLFVVTYPAGVAGEDKKVWSFDTTGAAVTSWSTSGGIGYDSSVGTYAQGIAWDGTNWWVVSHYVANSGLTEGFTLEKFDGTTHALISDTSASYFGSYTGWGGVAWNSTRSQLDLVEVNRESIMQLTSWTWTHSSGDKWYTAFSWYDGTNESLVSPRSTNDLGSAFTAYPSRYGRLTITVPALPSGITHARTYTVNSSSSPATTALKLQAPTTYTDSDTATTRHLILFNSSGAAPATVSGFTGGNSTIAGTGSAITSPWKIEGDGTMLLPTAGRLQIPASPSAGQILQAAGNGGGDLLSYTGNSGWRGIVGEYEHIGEGVRRALWRASGTARKIRSWNFQPEAATQITGNIGTGSRRMMAIWWPGGVVTGFAFSLAVAGVYTDSVPNSGAGVYTYDGTTFTRQASVTATNLWKTAGLQTKDFSSPSGSLAAQVLYVMVQVFNTAVTTNVVFQSVLDPGGAGGLFGAAGVGIATPTGYQQGYAVGSLGAATPPATILASGMTAATDRLPLVGLY